MPKGTGNYIPVQKNFLPSLELKFSIKPHFLEWHISPWLLKFFLFSCLSKGFARRVLLTTLMNSYEYLWWRPDKLWPKHLFVDKNIPTILFCGKNVPNDYIGKLKCSCIWERLWPLWSYAWSLKLDHTQHGGKIVLNLNFQLVTRTMLSYQ